MKKLFFMIMMAFIIISCGSDNLSNSKAEKIISQCLEQDPELRTVSITLKNKRFSKREQDLLAQYRQLQEDGFIEMTQIGKASSQNNDPLTQWRNRFKRFDIKLTKKAEKYIENAPEGGKKITMKAFEYDVDKVIEVQEIPAANKAKVKVQYEAVDITPFAILSRNDPSEYWIKTRTMTKTSNGWKYCDTY